jgi:hypothetical protein
MKSDRVFSFAEFKSLFRRANLNIPEQSLRNSYRGLDQLRKHKNLSWLEMREKVHALGNELQSELFKTQGHLVAARIPLTERDWDRMG